MNNNYLRDILSVTVAVILVLLIIMYNTPLGIKFGYWLSGGSTTKTATTVSTEELLKNYNDYKTTFELYKDSTNPTAQGWAKNAKEKANKIVDEYNKIEENKIEKIGE